MLLSCVWKVYNALCSCVFSYFKRKWFFSFSLELCSSNSMLANLFMSSFEWKFLLLILWLICCSMFSFFLERNWEYICLSFISKTWLGLFWCYLNGLESGNFCYYLSHPSCLYLFCDRKHPYNLWFSIASCEYDFHFARVSNMLLTGLFQVFRNLVIWCFFPSSSWMSLDALSFRVLLLSG